MNVYCKNQQNIALHQGTIAVITNIKKDDEDAWINITGSVRAVTSD
jgi:hypothetical protein